MAEATYPASRLHEDYHHYCQVLGRKPQSNGAIKKALDKLINVFQSNCSSGMQWHSIELLQQVLASYSVVSVGSIGILESFLQNILWRLFGFAYSAYTILSLFNEDGY